MEQKIEQKESQKTNLLEEAKNRHRLLWTKSHHKAVGSTPPEIFNEAEEDVPEIALLNEEEIKKRIKKYIEPKFSNLSELGGLGVIKMYAKRLSKLGQVFEYLAENGIFSPEERSEFKDKWKMTAQKFGIEIEEKH